MSISINNFLYWLRQTPSQKRIKNLAYYSRKTPNYLMLLPIVILEHLGNFLDTVDITALEESTGMSGQLVTCLKNTKSLEILETYYDLPSLSIASGGSNVWSHSDELAEKMKKYKRAWQINRSPRLLSSKEVHSICNSVWPRLSLLTSLTIKSNDFSLLSYWKELTNLLQNLQEKHFHPIKQLMINIYIKNYWPPPTNAVPYAWRAREPNAAEVLETQDKILYSLIELIRAGGANNQIEDLSFTFCIGKWFQVCCRESRRVLCFLDESCPQLKKLFWNSYIGCPNWLKGPCPDVELLCNLQDQLTELHFSSEINIKSNLFGEKFLQQLSTVAKSHVQNTQNSGLKFTDTPPKVCFPQLTKLTISLDSFLDYFGTKSYTLVHSHIHAMFFYMFPKVQNFYLPLVPSHTALLKGDFTMTTEPIQLFLEGLCQTIKLCNHSNVQVDRPTDIEIYLLFEMTTNGEFNLTHFEGAKDAILETVILAASHFSSPFSNHFPYVQRESHCFPLHIMHLNSTEDFRHSNPLQRDVHVLKISRQEASPVLVHINLKALYEPWVFEKRRIPFSGH